MHLMIRPVVVHSMEGPIMDPSSGQVAVGFRAAEAGEGCLVAGEGFAGGKRINCMGAIDEAQGSTSPQMPDSSLRLYSRSTPLAIHSNQQSEEGG